MVNIVLKTLFLLFLYNWKKKGLRIFWRYGLLNYQRFVEVFIQLLICASFEFIYTLKN